MTVSKTVADERRDQALGILSRRNAELVHRLTKGRLPKQTVLNAVQDILEGRFNTHYLLGPYDTPIKYPDQSVDYLPPGCDPLHGVKHVIKIPSEDIVHRTFFLLRFKETIATRSEMLSLINAWGYRPAVSRELRDLGHYHCLLLKAFPIVALGSVYTDEKESQKKVLVFQKIALEDRTRNSPFFWHDPDGFEEQTLFAVLEDEFSLKF